MVEFRNTPFGDVIKSAENLYGEITCDIYFGELQKTNKAHGVTQFCDDGTISIGLDVDTPYRHLVETLAHELAHTIVNDKNDDHGEKWKEVFENIYQEYNRYGEEKYGKYIYK